MRILEEVTEINYDKTRTFFRNRADKFKEDNPYSVTMYQDNNKELVDGRNRKEIEKLYPFLNLSENSRVLDVACGIGRWADAISTKIDEYLGVDFSSELIEIANDRNRKDNFSFCVGSATDIKRIVQQNNGKKFNVILLIGILIYVNDNDLLSLLKQIEELCEDDAVICIREPIGITDRLTLKDFFSDELKDNYNAIYRKREELVGFFEAALMDKGFKIRKEDFLFDEDKLNNRKETVQYYYILERGK